jgi:uncharacterized protein DUF4231
MKRPVLFRRVPKLRAPSSSRLLPVGVAEEFPALGSDIDALNENLFTDFEKLDSAALKSQNGFRLSQMVLIVGGLAATLLGAIQAALPKAAWAGIVEVTLVLVLGVLFVVSGQLSFQEDYLDRRLKAERLRAECFFFLARVGGYSALDETGSRALLEQRVALIKVGSAPE